MIAYKMLILSGILDLRNKNRLPQMLRDCSHPAPIELAEVESAIPPAPCPLPHFSQVEKHHSNAHQCLAKMDG